MCKSYIGGVDQVFVKQEFMDLTDPAERVRLVAEAQADGDERTPYYSLEADVMLSDGRVVRVTGKLAVDYKRNPEAVRKFVEEERAKNDNNIKY